RPCSCAEELAGNLLVQSFENEGFSDGRNAVRRRSADACVLDRLIERIGFLTADAFRIRSGADFCGFTDALPDPGTETGKRGGEKLGYRPRLSVLQHRDEPSQFDSIGVRLDLLRLRGELVR